MGKKQEWGMGSLEGGIGTRRRPKGQEYGAARCGRRNKKRRGRRRDLVNGREDATLLSGLNIVLIKLHQLVIFSITGYLK
jgi:hypothetical protein